MRPILVVLLAVAVEARARSGSCTVSEWGSWSDWTKEVNQHDVTYRKVADSEQMTAGEIQRHEQMRLKTEARLERRQCLMDGTCPDEAYLASDGYSPCTDGFSGTMNCPCQNIDQMAFLDFDTLGIIEDSNGAQLREGSDIWGWTSSATLKEYAIITTTHGTSFVDITDPINYFVVGVLRRPAGTDPSYWRDAKVIGDVVYLVSEADNSGIQVFDLTRLDSTSTFTNFNEDFFYGGLSNCHNLVSHPDKNVLYAVGCTRNAPQLCSGGLYVLDTSNPLNPSFVTCYGGDGYVHDAECVIYQGPDFPYVGREICFCYNEDTFTIVDVEDKLNIQLLSRTSYTGVDYTHQGSITADHTVVLMDDEGDENSGGDPITKTYVWDVSSLQNPSLSNVHRSTETSIDHNQYIIGDLTYQSNYEAGLRILRITGTDLTELAYFDVKPSRTTAAFYGSWSVYPYFQSGNVVVSSIDFGMWILRPNMAAISETGTEQETVASRRQRFRTVLEATDLSGCPTLSETQIQ